MDLLVKSPGVPAEAPLVAAARERGLTVWSEVELGFRLLANPILGVTGTNGKTTTSELLGEIFRAAGKAVAVAGNVGRPLIGSRRRHRRGGLDRLRALELPARGHRRASARGSPCSSTSTPDHLDRHASLEDYRAAKLRIFENQTAEDVAIVPRGLRADPGRGAADRVLARGSRSRPSRRIPGEHNRENAAAATAAARAAGISDDAIADGRSAAFAGVPHRLELVREVGGVRFVNDSKATNPEAAERALSAYPPGIRLILGGSRKGIPFGQLAKRAAGAGVAQAYLIGESADEIAEALAAAGVRFTYSRDLDCGRRTRSATRAGGGRPPLACLRKLRPVSRLRGAGDRFRELVEAL